jgi:hypothetical protein
MRYSDCKKHIKTGDIILWSGKMPHSRLIRWLTKSKWSHVGIAVWWGNRLMVLDSYPFFGTRARPLSHDLKNACWMSSGAAWNGGALAFALDELDHKYSFQNLWKTWLGLNLVKSEYHCAQYAAAVLAKAGVNIPMPPTPESIARQLGRIAEPVALEATGNDCNLSHLQNPRN